MSDNLLKAIEIMIYGWGGVFVVLLIIYAACIILTKMSRKVSKDNE